MTSSSSFARPDPKPERRVIDRALMRRLHVEWRECAICGESAIRLSLHHVHKHPRNDLRENLVMLCGDGTRGCHGLIENGDRQTRARLGAHVAWYRPDIVTYLDRQLGGSEQGTAWLRRYLYAPL